MVAMVTNNTIWAAFWECHHRRRSSKASLVPAFSQEKWMNVLEIMPNCIDLGVLFNLVSNFLWPICAEDPWIDENVPYGPFDMVWTLRLLQETIQCWMRTTLWTTLRPRYLFHFVPWYSMHKNMKWDSQHDLLLVSLLLFAGIWWWWARVQWNQWDQRQQCQQFEFIT